MNYLIKFDDDGRRGETYVAEEKTAEEIQELIDAGYEVITEENYQLLIGNVDGKEHIRKADGTYSEYVPPAPTLDELKTAKIAALKAERDNKEVEPIEYNGNSFDYDEKARDRINAAIIALEVAGESASLEWTSADNTDVTVTAADLKGIISAVAVRSNALHVAYRAAKEQVASAQSKEDLEAIVLN